jgi:hypothetical protein
MTKEEREIYDYASKLIEEGSDNYSVSNGRVIQLLDIIKNQEKVIENLKKQIR